MAKQVLERLRELSETTVADMVTGPYDIICILQADLLDKLGNVVEKKIREFDGVSKTMSCISLTLKAPETPK